MLVKYGGPNSARSPHFRIQTIYLFNDFIKVSVAHHCIYLLPGASAVEYSPRNTRKSKSAAENVFIRL